MTEQLVLALKSWTEESRAWKIVWVQLPEAARNRAIVHCARLVAQAIEGAQPDDGEGDERAE
jgi:hypothetical protein